LAEKRAALRPPILNRSGCQKLIEVFFGPGRRAVPPPPWPDAPRLAEGPDVRKLPEAAPAAPQQAEGLDGRKPPEAAPAAELLVSQRRPAVG